jgi:hypothetical protein
VRKLLVGCTVVLAALAAPAGALAATPWSSATEIRGASVPATPLISFSRTGTGLALWPNYAAQGPLLASRWGGQSFGAAGPLPGALVVDPFAGGIALYGQQRMAAAGRLRSGRPAAALGSVEGGLGKPARLGNVQASGIAITSNVDGFVAVAFTDRHGMHVSARRPGRRFPRPVLVSRARGARFPAVATNVHGDVLTGWYARGHVYTRFRSAAGHFESARNVGPAPGGTVRMSLALSKRRRGLIAWASEPISEALATGPAVQSVAYASRRARFGKHRVLETFDDEPFTAQAGTGYVEGIGIAAAFATTGEPLVTWTGRNGNFHVVRSTRLVSGRPETAQTLSAPGREAEVQALAIGPLGEALAVWTEAPDQVTGRTTVFAAPRAAGTGGFGAAEQVSPDGDAVSPGGGTFYLTSATGAIDPASARPVVIWLAGTPGTAPAKQSVREPLS